MPHTNSLGYLKIPTKVSLRWEFAGSVCKTFFSSDCAWNLTIIGSQGSKTYNRHITCCQSSSRIDTLQSVPSSDHAWEPLRLRLSFTYTVPLPVFASKRTHHSSNQERKQLTSALYTINSKYRVSWVYAELSCSSNLVMEIPLPMQPSPSDVCSPRLLMSSVTSRNGHPSRERTITLGNTPTGDAH